MADAQAMTIPEQAVQAALDKWRDHELDGTLDNPRMRAALTAAAPYMSSSTREQALEEALKQARYWHEEHDKAISKQPNANIGRNGWMRLQHQEQISEIDAALKSQKNTETSVIEKKKFYHNEWPHDALMAARHDGFIDHNGGEAWRYQFTHKDEKGKYDLLYRDTSNSSIQAALPPAQTGSGEWTLAAAAHGKVTL